MTVIGMMAAIVVAAILLAAYRWACVKAYSDQYRIFRNRHAHSAEIFRNASRLAAQGAARLWDGVSPSGKAMYAEMGDHRILMAVDIFRGPAKVCVDFYPGPVPPIDPAQEAALDRRAAEVAAQCLEMANYHDLMAKKWEAAASYPWRGVTPDAEVPHPQLQVETSGIGDGPF